MKLSPEERSIINRKNASLSTGPKSERGKRAVSMNACKHGMCARKVTLPHEAPEAVERRLEQWAEACRPADAMEHYLVEQAVRASLNLDRCHEQRTALLAKQVREAPHEWENEKQDEVERLRELLVDDPEAAVRELRRSAHGCRWLLGRWYDLDDILKRDGRWCGPERDEATRLLGHRPEVDRIVESEATFQTRLFNLLCHPDPSPVAIEWLCDPARRPESLQWTYRVDRLPGRAECLKALRDRMAGEVVALEELEEELRTELDEPDLAEAATRALVPLDESKARLMLRYQTTAENSLYRAYNALVKARKGREAAGEDSEPVAPVVTVVEAPLAVTGPLPNKANPADDAPEGPDGPLPNKAKSDAMTPAGPLRNKANFGSEAPVGPLPNEANPGPEGSSEAPETLPNKANPARTGASDGPAPRASSAAESDVEPGRSGIEGPCGPWATPVQAGPMA